MRSTPARQLHKGQLLVDRYAVHKITEWTPTLPHNTVTVELTNQLTSQQTSRNLRWDEHVTVEEPLELKVGETGQITVELAQLSNDEGRPVYRYRLVDDAARIEHEAADLRLGVSANADNKKAMSALLSFLSASGEAYWTELDNGIDSENRDLFPDPIPEYAHQMSEEIRMAQIELEGGLER